MRGSMREKRPGYWELRVHAGRDPITGKEVVISRGFKGTKKAAGGALADLVTDVRRGTIGSSDATLAEAMGYWINHVAAKERAAITLAKYRQIASVISKAPLGGMMLRDIETHHIQAFYDGLRQRGMSPRTINHYHGAIRATFKVGIARKWVTGNPSLATARPTVRASDIAVPSPAQVAAIIATATEDAKEYGMFVRLAADSWARRGELVALRRSALLLDPPVGRTPQMLVASSASVLEGIKDTKTGKKRVIALGRGTAAALAEHLERMDKRAANAGVDVVEDAFVFSDEADCSVPWPVTRPSRFFTRAMKAAGLVGFRLHDLRHFGATQAIAAGVAITTVSHQLGHSQVTQTLNTYSHFIPSTGDRVSALMDELLASPPGLPTAAHSVTDGAGDESEENKLEADGDDQI